MLPGQIATALGIIHMGKSTLYSRIYEIVNHIPQGKVATYGQIASLAGMPGHARQVGYALHSLPEGSEVPWQRVINRKGQISLRSNPSATSLQRALLESEGIIFDENEAISLEKYQWHIPFGQFDPSTDRDKKRSPTSGCPPHLSKRSVVS